MWLAKRWGRQERWVTQRGHEGPFSANGNVLYTLVGAWVTHTYLFIKTQQAYTLLHSLQNMYILPMQGTKYAEVIRKKYHP